MRALIVFESMFGNTQRIAEAVAGGLSGYAQVDLVEVGQAPIGIDAGLDLLVVGAPTQVFGLSSPNSREGALKQAPDGLASRGIGLREWLAALPGDAAQVPAAAFDTRLAKPAWVTGSAARGAAKRLRRRGHPMVAPAESFLVEGTPGPLRDGEVARARAWGARLGAKRAAATARGTTS
jgi:hypothetical protein